MGTLSLIWLVTSFGVSRYTTTKRFVRDFATKKKKKSDEEDDLMRLFNTNEEYTLFIKMIKDNKQWDGFCNNMLYRAAIIRNANKKGYFKEEYRIKELRKLLKKGSYYLDRRKDLGIYTDENLSFIEHK